MLALGAGVAVAVCAFRAGGYFAGTQSTLLAVLCLAALLRLSAARRPAEGIGRAAAVAVGALTLLGGWMLLSSAWSHAPARAAIESDRAAMYALVILVFAAFPQSPDRGRWLVRALATTIALVALAALCTRLLPTLWPITQDVRPQRLSFPVTYWNALGLLCAMGTLLSLHLACNARERWFLRLAGAGFVPILGLTVYLTVSRGAIAALAVGLVVYLAVGWPKGLLGGLLATVPTTAAVLWVAQGADRISTAGFADRAAAGDRHSVLLALAIGVVGAVAIRAAFLPLDRRPARVISPSGRRARALGAAGVAVVLLVTAVALGAVGQVRHQVDRFASGDRVQNERQRLFDAGNNGRIDQWRVAVDAYRAQPVHGQGAGTYPIAWTRDRPDLTKVADAHSLYVEVMGELGLVGLGLLLVAVLTMLGGMARRVRGPDRAQTAALTAVFLMWALHAGIDWDWEMPVVTLPAMAAAGTVLALARGRGRLQFEPPSLVRLLGSLGLIILAVLPVRIAISQGYLNTSARAFAGRDCPGAVRDALKARSAFPSRPDPYVIIAYCDVRLGQPALGARIARRAVSVDPGWWENAYALALTRGAAGLDPRPAARLARRLNPNEPLTTTLVQRFRGAPDPQKWRRRALGAHLPED